MKRSRLVLALVVLPFAIIKIAAGCAAQQEGQLCNTLNNISDDCASGLVCMPMNGYGVCCPQSGSTNPACMTTTVVTDGGGGGAGGGGGGTTTTTASGTGGVSGTGGMSGTGGKAGTGGMAGTGGVSGTGGSAIVDAGDGG